MDSATANAMLSELRTIRSLLSDLVHLQAAMLQAVAGDDEVGVDLEGEVGSRDRDEGEPL